MGAAAGHCCSDDRDASANLLDQETWQREVSGGSHAPKASWRKEAVYQTDETTTPPTNVGEADDVGRCKDIDFCSLAGSTNECCSRAGSKDFHSLQAPVVNIVQYNSVTRAVESQGESTCHTAASQLSTRRGVQGLKISTDDGELSDTPRAEEAKEACGTSSATLEVPPGNPQVPTPTQLRRMSSGNVLGEAALLKRMGSGNTLTDASLMRRMGSGNALGEATLLRRMGSLDSNASSAAGSRRGAALLAPHGMRTLPLGALQRRGSGSLASPNTQRSLASPHQLASPGAQPGRGPMTMLRRMASGMSVLTRTGSNVSQCLSQVPSEHTCNSTSSPGGRSSKDSRGPSGKHGWLRRLGSRDSNNSRLPNSLSSSGEACVTPRTPGGSILTARTPRMDKLDGAVVAMMRLVSGSVEDDIDFEDRGSNAWSRQVSSILGALESDGEEDEEIEAPYSNHCYFYNLEIRGRHPKCEFKACQCGQVHERIPDEVFEYMAYPSLSGTGSDAELRKRFVEIDSNRNNYIGRKEMRQAVEASGVSAARALLDAVMRLLDEDGKGRVSFASFSLVGRLSLQLYNSLFGIAASQVGFTVQEASIKKFFAGAIGKHQPVTEDHLLKLFEKADVRVEGPTVARLLAALDAAGNRSLREPEVKMLFDALCIVAHLMMPGGDADPAALGQIRELVSAGVSAAFQGERPKKRAKPAAKKPAAGFGESGVASAEMRNIFRSFGLEVDPSRMAKIIAMFDDDGNGEVEFCEFKRLFDISVKWHEFVKMLSKSASKMGGLTDADLRREFLKIDKDRNGSIDLDELDDCFRSKGISLDRSDLTKVMMLADTDGSESVEWPEFRRMFHIIATATHL